MATRFDEKELLLRQRYHAELCMEWARTNHILTMRRLSLKYNPNQPRVGAGNPAGGQWLGQNVGRSGAGGSSVGDDGEITGTVPKRSAAQKPGVVAPLPTQPTLDRPGTGRDSFPQQVQFTPTMPMPGVAGIAIGMIGAAIALYNYLNSRPQSGETIVLELESREYGRSEAYSFEFAFVRSLNQSETQSICPRLEEVQDRVDRVDQDVSVYYPEASAQQHGTEVHKRLAIEINNLLDPKFRAEISISNEKVGTTYGERNSIRVDILEEVSPSTVCVYDTKTGKAELTIKRANEIAEKIFRAFGKVPLRIVVTEVRPRK